MKAAELRAFKDLLLAIRARLRGDVSTMADAALGRAGDDGRGSLSTMPIHMADLGSDAFEQEFTLSLMATEEGTLEAVDEALGRIRAKTFGLCEACGGIISKKRLEAIPFAALCIRCAEKEEQRGPGRPAPQSKPTAVRGLPRPSARPGSPKGAKAGRPRQPR